MKNRIMHMIFRIAVFAAMAMMAMGSYAQQTGEAISSKKADCRIDQGNGWYQDISRRKYHVTELDGTEYDVLVRTDIFTYHIKDKITGEVYEAYVNYYLYNSPSGERKHPVTSQRGDPNCPRCFFGKGQVIGWADDLGLVDDDMEEEETGEGGVVSEKEFKNGLIGTIMGTFITIMVLGGGAGGNGGNGGNNPIKFPPQPRPSDKYVWREPDGTVVSTNPITKEIDYLPPETDEEAIREQVEHVLDNRDYYERIQNQHDQWTKEQRAAMQREIAQRNAEWERKLAEKQAREEALRKQQLEEAKRRQERIEKLMEEHGAGSEEFLRRNMIRDMGIDEARYWRQMSLSDGIDSAMTATNAVKNAADVGMDICAAVGGKKAELIRDGYKVATEMTSTITDAIITGKDLKTEMKAGLVRAGITVSQYHTSGKLHVLTTVGGEATRDMINAYNEGKSTWEIFKAGLKGGARGAENAFVDHYTNKISGVATNKVSNQNGIFGKTASKVTDSDTAKRIIKEVEAAGDDIGKLWGDSFFG